MSTFIDIVSKVFRFNNYKKNKLKGAWGEMKVTFGLKMLLSVEYKSFTDVLIELPNNKYSQIDHVVISPYGIFVVETKNYKGSLTVNGASDNWTQSFTKSDYGFYSPVEQNQSHIDALSYLLDDDALPFNSIICFIGKGEFTNQFIPEEIEFGVKDLVKAIKAHDTKLVDNQHAYMLARRLKERKLANSKVNKQLHLDYVKGVQSKNRY